jgi:predicted transcriptional regulator
MRTTVNLPDDVHRRIVSLAKDMNATFSEAVVDLVRRGFGQPHGTLAMTIDGETGLPQIELGDVVTTDDVQRILDED